MPQGLTAKSKATISRVKTKIKEIGAPTNLVASTVDPKDDADPVVLKVRVLTLGTFYSISETQIGRLQISTGQAERIPVQLCRSQARVEDRSFLDFPLDANTF